MTARRRLPAGLSPGAEIIATIAWLRARGLYSGTSGNISARAGDGFVITPTGVPCEDLRAVDLVPLDADGAPARGAAAARPPSSEWRIHRDIYRARPEVTAVVHTHSTFATALSALRRDLPAFHYVVAKAGGPTIRCARYATYGTARLSAHALAALDGRRACLLANHGLVAVGPNLSSARLLAEEVEALCQQYAIARAVGRPRVLPAAEMRRVLVKFASYGRAPEPRPGARRRG